MAYITIADLETKIPPKELLELTDRDSDGEADDNVDDILVQAIADGTGKFHSYVGRRYALPLATSDSVLMDFVKPIVIDFSWAALYPRADMVPDKLQRRIDEHVKRLTDIREGKADLPAGAAPPTSQTATSGIAWSSAARKSLGGMP